MAAKRSLDLDVLPGLPRWRDQRLTNIRFNEYAYPPPPVTTKKAWQERAAWVRRRVLTAAGLSPMPERTPLHPRVWGEFEHEGVRVAKAHFESRPGFLCTGNLFLPPALDRPAPAVLCPHGHWKNGRMQHTGQGSVPARCIMLARLGFVVFAYDMIGYKDSRQMVHRWPLDLLREASLWGLSPFGIQLWNSIRALDFVSGLDEVDADRIGCTGASGGASQTWNLAAVDERVKAAAPVCMLSGHYQGGCQCEEGPLLRLGDLTSIDLVGALAPRPVMLPAVTGDWTNMNPKFEAPAVRAIYRLFKAEDRVSSVYFDDGHNYNKATRESVYPFFLRALAGDGDAPERIEEPPLRKLPKKARIFTAAAAPTMRDTKDALKAMRRAIDRRYGTPPTTKKELAAFREDLSGPYAETLGVCPGPADVAVRVVGGGQKAAGMTVSRRLLSRRGVGDVVPALWIVPKEAPDDAPAALVAHGKGKAALFERGRPTPLLRGLAGAGRRVLAIDVLGAGDTGNLFKDGDPREASDPVFYAFNPSWLAMRVQDVLTALSALRGFFDATDVSLCGVGEGSRAALLALPLAGEASAAAFDLRGVSRSPEGWSGDAHHPMILSAGEFKTAVALAAPLPLALNHADKDLRAWTEGVYSAAGASGALRLERAKADSFARAVSDIF